MTCSSRGDTRPPAIIIAGPTASGKSALALMVAEHLRGVVINADSMQVYDDLRILTARPTPQEEARIPHRLYGVRAAAEPGSAAWWRGEALAAMQAAHQAGFVPVLTGGTGLYFAALTHGLADIPDPGPAARDEARHLLAQHGPEALHASLSKVDPATAARLKPADSQRLARAWEVWRGTGRGLAAWQSIPPEPAPWRFTAVLLDPPRDALRAAIALRFQSMLDQGAVQEVRLLLEQGLSPAVPLMRAHGVPELSAYLRGEMTLQDAARRTETVTAQYTKRQATWFRHHFLADQPRVRKIVARFQNEQQFSESERQDLLLFVQKGG